MEINHLKDKQVLIADDDYGCYRYLKAILEKTGANIHMANNGLNAVDFIKSNPNVDIVFMDLNMPIMGGYEAIEHIRLVNKEIPIIIQSCNENITYKENPIQHNIEFIQKPFKPSDVYAALDKILHE
ncbi:MAG: response regulator [Bacteroidia bacterium]|nr:response regulator [Bacteroidia bacterium]